jgi:hypothetical protein
MYLHIFEELKGVTGFAGISLTANLARNFSSPYVIYVKLHCQMPLKVLAEDIDDERSESLGCYFHTIQFDCLRIDFPSLSLSFSSY